MTRCIVNEKKDSSITNISVEMLKEGFKKNTRHPCIFIVEIEEPEFFATFLLKHCGSPACLINKGGT